MKVDWFRERPIFNIIRNLISFFCWKTKHQLRRECEYKTEREVTNIHGNNKNTLRGECKGVLSVSLFNRTCKPFHFYFSTYEGCSLKQINRDSFKQEHQRIWMLCCKVLPTCQGHLKVKVIASRPYQFVRLYQHNISMI